MFALIGAGLSVRAPAEPPPEPVKIAYEIRVVPTERSAHVTMEVVQQRGGLERVHFDFDPTRFSAFEGPGVEVTTAAERDEAGVANLDWAVPKQGGSLRFVALLDTLRGQAAYDARCTRSWALFRGSDVLPPIRTSRRSGVRAEGSVRFRLPSDWRVVTPFVRKGAMRFDLDQPGRGVETPRGWMLAGEIDVVSEPIAGVQVAVAAPQQHDARPQDRVALLRWALPELVKILDRPPERLLVVSAEDPMWRGGLSGPGSLYLHAERPLIDDDGTSPLLHELMHVAMRASSGPKGDWIVEGLAEYYSIELLARSGTISPERAEATRAALAKRGATAETLLVPHAKGAVTARAVTTLATLDRRIRKVTEGRASLDDVVRAVASDPERLSLDRFREHVAQVAGQPLDAFFDSQVD